MEDKNASLLTIPSPEEIKSTLFQMQDLKAPGSDGFPVLFYKQFLPTIGKDVTNAVILLFLAWLYAERGKKILNFSRS